MARPTTKHDLIEAATLKYNKLIQALSTISDEALESSFTYDASKEKEAHWTRDQNVRDVLIHLYEWHMLLINWIDSNQKGIKNQFLRNGYNWKTYGAMNVEFCKEHQNTTLQEALSLLDGSHKKVIELAESLSNDELFSKGSFDWVGGTTLGSYFVSATSSHYDWALKKIKKNFRC